jgi:hypothetical protein
MLAEVDEPWVLLSTGELHIAAMIGCHREIQNLAMGRKHTYGATQDLVWGRHIEGAAGEMAFAKWSNKFWSGNLGDLKASDVGNAEIRTRSNHNWQLFLHKEDPDDRVFILVTGLAPEFRLRGWIWGREGKRPEYWSDPTRKNRPAYFVPNAVLRPMTVSARARSLLYGNIDPWMESAP